MYIQEVLPADASGVFRFSFDVDADYFYQITKAVCQQGTFSIIFKGG